MLISMQSFKGIVRTNLIIIILPKTMQNFQTLSVISPLTNGNENICQSAHHSGTFLIRSPHEYSSNTVHYFIFTDSIIKIKIFGECKKKHREIYFIQLNKIKFSLKFL